MLGAGGKGGAAPLKYGGFETSGGDFALERLEPPDLSFEDCSVQFIFFPLSPQGCLGIHLSLLPSTAGNFLFGGFRIVLRSGSPGCSNWYRQSMGSNNAINEELPVVKDTIRSQQLIAQQLGRLDNVRTLGIMTPSPLDLLLQVGQVALDWDEQLLIRR